MPLLQAFPFPSTLGEVTLHLLSQACVYIYSSRGKWVFPLSCRVFPPPLLLQAFLLLIGGHVLLLLLASVLVYSSRGRWVFPPLLWRFPTSATLTSSWLLVVRSRSLPLWPGLAPSPFFGTWGTPPSLLCVFIFLIAYYSVSLFSPGGGRSVQGAMLVWPRDVCGSTRYHLAHLVVSVFPSHLGAGDWR
jgi:hypothetical protein